MQSNSANVKYEKSIKDGALRELEAIKLFIQKEYTISVPNMSVRYDFIAEKYPVIVRVQVKSLNLKKPRTENKLSYNVWQLNAYSNPNRTKRPYSKKDCDMVVGICLDTGTFAIVPIDKIADRTAPYRLSEHINSEGRNYLNSYIALDNFSP